MLNYEAQLEEVLQYAYFKILDIERLVIQVFEPRTCRLANLLCISVLIVCMHTVVALLMPSPKLDLASNICTHASPEAHNVVSCDVCISCLCTCLARMQALVYMHGTLWCI